MSDEKLNLFKNIEDITNKKANKVPMKHKHGILKNSNNINYVSTKIIVI